MESDELSGVQPAKQSWACNKATHKSFLNRLNDSAESNDYVSDSYPSDSQIDCDSDYMPGLDIGYV